MRVVIYTDGACKGNPGPGGWGAVLQWGGVQKELCGGEAQTTNNRMEMTAAIIALETLKRKCNVVLYTDSKYLKDGITEWMPQWKKNAAAAASKTALENCAEAGGESGGEAGGKLLRKEGKKYKPVKNADLWERLSAATARHMVEWRWVKGHADNAGNMLADALACRGADDIANKEETP